MKSERVQFPQGLADSLDSIPKRDKKPLQGFKLDHKVSCKAC